MIKKCQGCGYTLQSDDSSKLGYVPKTKNKNPKLCERCFKIIHYNDAKIVTLPIEENKEIIMIYTCYPFKGTDRTQYRYVVYAEKI